MENEQNNTSDDTLRDAKPKLTIDDQITLLKDKGVKFELCSEDEAREWLTDYSFYFQIASYRVLFQKYVGGENDGKYIDLDFFYLVELFRLDDQLRATLFPMTQDIEQSARTSVVARVTEDENEDGYTIVSEYMKSLSGRDRKRRDQELDMLGADTYSGALIAKYGKKPPVWVFAELLSFGAFIDFYLFCAKRWGDKDLLDEHYLLRQAKKVRNATAHGSAIINGLNAPSTHIRANESVNSALVALGVSSHQRSTKMKNPRLQQIVSLLYLYKELVEDETRRARATKQLNALTKSLGTTRDLLSSNDTITSSFDFLTKVAQGWFEAV